MAEDGKSFLYQANPRDEKSLDLFEYNLASKRSTLIWKSDGSTELTAVGHDHRRFVTSEQHSDVDNDLYVIDRAFPDKRELVTPHTGAARFAAQYISPDGKTLYATSDANGEFTSLVAINLATKASTPVVAGNWDIDFAAVSSTGRYSLTSANADGSPELVVTEGADRRRVQLPSPPKGGSWDPSDETSWGRQCSGSPSRIDI